MFIFNFNIQSLFSQQPSTESNQMPVNNAPTDQSAVEEARGVDNSKVAPGKRQFIRRKSGLPGDMETVLAMRQYNTVDKVLQPSKES